MWNIKKHQFQWGISHRGRNICDGGLESVVEVHEKKRHGGKKKVDMQFLSLINYYYFSTT